ncbi:MAG TPA: hypothetical protein VF763_14305 [Candidatus Limnocylindrales bacterium]
MRVRRRLDRRRLGLVVVAVGLALAWLVQVRAPVAGPPLYDGVITVDPYRYLDPPPGQRGDPLSASATEQPENGQSPVTAVATGEQPPQAQIFAAPGALVLPPGTTSIAVSISPVRPASQPSDGRLDGNVYRISLLNQGGAAIASAAGAKTTVVLRGPAGVPDPRIEWYSGGAWNEMPTSPAGLADTYLTTVTDFGDFALVVPGAASSGPAPSEPVPTGAPVTPAPSPGAVAPGSAGSGLATVAIVVALLLALLLVARVFVRPRQAPPGRRR